MVRLVSSFLKSKENAVFVGFVYAVRNAPRRPESDKRIARKLCVECLLTFDRGDVVRDVRQGNEIGQRRLHSLLTYGPTRVSIEDV